MVTAGAYALKARLLKSPNRRLALKSRPMLNSIVDVSLRYKVLVLVGFLLVVVFGVQAFRAVPVDAFPDVTPVQVNIYTESPGACGGRRREAAHVPRRDRHGRLARRGRDRSVSLFGLSYVSVYFKDNVDIYFAPARRRKKLLEAKTRIPGVMASRCWDPIVPGWDKCSGTRSNQRPEARRWICAPCRTGTCGCFAPPPAWTM